MNRVALVLLALVSVCAPALSAREITGQWQGTLPVEGGVRLVLKVARSADGSLSATYYSIDQSPEGHPVKSVTLDDSTFRFDFAFVADRFEGTLSEDGKTIAGKWFGSRHPGTFYPLDLYLASGAEAWPIDSSAHQIQFVRVDGDIKLEVLDWGGIGRPLVFLAGLGNDAHIFDAFAPKFTPQFHVYGITRRGFGASSKPDPSGANYSSDRLGDDVLAVIQALKLDRPVLVGHSIAGEELSSIGSRHPKKVAGLVYLDAAYSQGFYDQAQGDFQIDSNVVMQKLNDLNAYLPLGETKRLTRELLQADLPQLMKSLAEIKEEQDAFADEAAAPEPPKDLPLLKYARAIHEGEQKYTHIPCPVLAFFAIHATAASGAKPDPDWTEAARAYQKRQIAAFEAGVPTAKVVRLQDADHYVFKSNEAEVLRDMKEFCAELP